MKLPRSKKFKQLMATPGGLAALSKILVKRMEKHDRLQKEKHLKR